MTEQTTSLYQAALFIKNIYQANVLNSRSSEKTSSAKLESLFLPRHFHHLMGLHKLKDIPRLRKATESVYREILSKKITDADIQKSVYFDQIRERLIYHEELLRLLHVESVFFRSLLGKSKGIAAECVLTKPTSDNAGFGFLFMALQADVYFPCSFLQEMRCGSIQKTGHAGKLFRLKRSADTRVDLYIKTPQKSHRSRFCGVCLYRFFGLCACFAINDRKRFVACKNVLAYFRNTCGNGVLGKTVAPRERAVADRNRRA